MVKVVKLTYGIIFLAETCQKDVSLEPYFKKSFHSLETNPQNRGISCFYDPDICSPEEITVIEPYDILSVKTHPNEYVVGIYRNHSHPTQNFLECLSSHIQNLTLQGNRVQIIGDFNDDADTVKNAMLNSGVWYDGSTAHHHNSATNITYIDHVFSNHLCLSLSGSQSLEAKTPYGHQVMHTIRELPSGTPSTPQPVERLNISQFKKMWRSKLSKFSSSFNKNLSTTDLNQKTEFFMNHILQITKDCTKTTLVKPKIEDFLNLEQDLQIEKSSKPGSRLKAFYEGCRRWFKGSIYSRASNTRSDEKFIKVLDAKLQRNIPAQRNANDNLTHLRKVFVSESVSTEEIYTIIDGLSNSGAKDLFNLSGKEIKLLKKELSPFIAKIATESLRRCTFPTILAKQTKMYGLFKSKGSKESPKNYRPISILCWVTKCMEKLILERLQIVCNNQPVPLIHPQQHAYRPNHSCNTAMIELMNLYNKESNPEKCLIFVDYRGAFDAISISPLVEKISTMNEMLGRVIESYLKNVEWQFVQPDGSRRSLRNQPGKGLPQGSILSPYLYSIYDTSILDSMQKAIDRHRLAASVCGYADDHVFVCDSPQTAERVLETFTKICARYGMILESSKTELVTCDKKALIRCVHEDTKAQVVVNSKAHVKWLGFNIRFHNNQMSIILASLYRLSTYLDELRGVVNGYSLEVIYRIYIQSSLNYYYPVAEILGQRAEFLKLETKLRATLGDILKSLPWTQRITFKQTDLLKKKLYQKPYYLR